MGTFLGLRLLDIQKLILTKLLMILMKLRKLTGTTSDI